MPDANPEITTWGQGILAAGVFLGGLVYSVIKLAKSASKKDDELPLTVEANAKLVQLAKENAELKAQQVEERIRRDFDIQIQDVRQDFAEVMRSGREAFYNRLSEIDGKVNGLQISLSGIEGMLSDRLPPRRQR